MKAELQQILRALQNAAELIPYAKNDPSDPSNLGSTAEASPQSWIRSVNEVAEEVQAAIAALDKLEAQPQAKVLTDEEIEHLAQGRIMATSSGQIACIDGGQESDVHGFSDGLRYARDNGYLAPFAFPVDEVMGEVADWYSSLGIIDLKGVADPDILRARLNAKFNTPNP